MDKATVIALAREAGLKVAENISGVMLVGSPLENLPSIAHIDIDEMHRFAELIRDHLTWSDIHTCHPGCTKPPCVAMRKAEAHAAAVEREACAQVAEDATAAWTEHDHNDACMHIANAIRSRT